MNYVNENSIYGLMNKNCNPDWDNKVIYKNKAKTKIVSFDPNYKNENAKQINYMYLDTPVADIKCSKEKQIIQGIYNQDYFELKSKKNRDMRNTRNKFNKIVKIYTDYDLQKVDSFIYDTWFLKRGDQLYGFQCHYGYDRAYFSKWYNNEKFINLFFEIDNRLVGYSVIERYPKKNEKGVDEFVFLLRKVDVEAGRNICEYVDFKTYEYIFKNISKEFVVNLGCSSGKLFWYKTTKFPVYELSDKYFGTWKKKEEI